MDRDSTILIVARLDATWSALKDLLSERHGYRVLMAPDAELYHLESKTRGYEDTPEKLGRFQHEYRMFQSKWDRYLKAGDPFYNQNFRLDRADYALRA